MDDQTHVVKQKTYLLNCLDELLSHNVLGDRQYKNRYNGFTAELAFCRWHAENRDTALLDGGMFLPIQKSDNSFQRAIYYTVTERPPADFQEVYRAAKNLASEGQFLIQIQVNADPFTWEKNVFFKTVGTELSIAFPVPPFQAYRFHPESGTFKTIQIDEIRRLFKQEKPALKKKVIPNEMKLNFINKFSAYDLAHIKKLYADRLFFDGFFNLTLARGAPLDIDTFVLGRDGRHLILEIKEKDQSKNSPIGFGMDTRRIDSLQKLAGVFDTKAFYLVSHINNQIERRHIDWRIIDMNKFQKKTQHSPVVEGGTGMRSTSSHNPTKVCAFAEFTQLT